MASGSRNFLKELYSPECAELDIVAVHGLNPTDTDFHAERTWTASNGSMWLRDFLTKKLQTARVLLFGYNANVAFQTSTAGVREQAENLLNRLKNKRRDAMDRPILFVCHSLGGLVVKRALVIAKAAETYLSIKNATYGIVFFGTPHQGGNFASLGSIAASIARLSLRNPSNSFMETLKTDSLFADDLVQDFRQQLEDYYVLSFYETLPFKKLGVIVDKRSATLGLPLNRETQIALNSNHSEICKFESTGSDDYEQVEGNIVELTKKALHAVAEKAGPAAYNAPRSDDHKQVGGNIVKLAKKALHAGTEKAGPTAYSAPGLRQLNLVSASESKVPFRRNDDFIGRETILVELEKLLAYKEGYQPRAVLYGLGGTGKTQIAVEYAYRTGSNGVNAYWINGESDETFNTNYSEIAKASSLAITGEKTEAICAKVKAWLESKESGDWLLLIDNFDDIRLESIRWLPSRNGAILFTSRDKRTVGTFASSNAGIKVDMMTDSEAMQTFARLTIGHTAHVGQPETRQLLRLLENLPLAIVQASTYIRQTGISITDYISSFLSSENGREELFENDLKSFGDFLAIQSRPVMTTWTITIETIQKENPLAVQLLRLMSFLDGRSIPKSLLCSLQWPVFGNKLTLAKTIGALLNFSLVSQPSRYEYRLHNLVGFWTRVRLNAEGRENSLRDAVQLVSMNFPEGTFDNLQQCSLLLPHAISIVKNTEETNQPSRLIRDLELRMAQHLEERGLYRDAEEYAQKSLDISRVLGLTDQDLSINENLLGTVVKSQGKYAEALKWYGPALSGMEKALGAEHPSVLETVDNMGTVYYYQGQYDEALRWHGRALAGREKALGSEHPSTLVTVNNMGKAYLSQGRYGEALEWCGRALAGGEKVLGVEHPSTLMTVSNMGTVCYCQGRYDEALKWYERALASKEKALGPEHPSSLTVVGDMGSVYRLQGRYDEALKWYERALAGNEKALGPEHPSSLTVVGDIGSVYRLQGRYDEALKWYERALAGNEKALGPEHPSSLTVVGNIGSVYRLQGRYDEALKWCERALAGNEKALGPEHPSSLTVVGDIGSVYRNQGRYDEALKWYERALAGKEKALGPEHPSSLTVVGDIGSVYRLQGRYDEALKWHERALAGNEKALGPEHPSSLTVVGDIGSVCRHQGRYDEALKWYERALAGNEKALGPEHPETMMVINNIGATYHDQNKYDEALEWFEHALAGKEKALGPEHPVTLVAVSNIGCTCYSRGRYGEALKWFERALAGREKALGSEHPSTRRTADKIRRCKRSLNSSLAGGFRRFIAKVID
ncbi:MAG: hypothetical protein M1813_006753 [Trichoglossum hirsutum]|nr:MAG: hypothetical protein M1813_006753 [Trichoglossum hirsutum]